MNYIKNIDTIYILVDIESYENSSSKTIQYLEEQKLALKTADKGNYSHVISVGNISFEIFSTGVKGYSYILHNLDYQINIAQFRSSLHSFYPIQVRISSEALWCTGIKKAWSNIYTWIEENFGKIINTKVCRIDLCLHTSDIDFITDFENVYKGKFKKYVTTFNGSSINSLCFGSRKGKNIYCRIYNKTLEVRETKSKVWFFDIWKENNMDIEKVWNLEFELKSEFLRELKLSTIEEVCSSLPNLWKYCTEEWLVKIDRTRSRKERCPTNNLWSEIQKVYESFSSKEFIKREKQLSLEASSLVPNIIGNITSYSARKRDYDLQHIVYELEKVMTQYLKQKETTFSEEVFKKRKVLDIYRKENYKNG